MLFDSPSAPAAKPAGSWLVAQLLDLGPKLLLATLVALALRLSIGGGLLSALGRDQTLTFFMTGSFAIHMWTRPGWRDFLGVIGAGALLGSGHALAWGGPNPSYWNLCGAFLGVGSLVVLCIRTLRAKGEQQRGKLQTLLAASGFPFLSIAIGLLLGLTPTWYPKTYDLYLYAFDGSLGFQPSFRIGRLFGAHLWLQELCGLVYVALPLNVAFLYAWHRMNTRRLPVNVLMLLITASVVSFMLYSWMPSAGPVYLFQKAFPWGQPDLAGLRFEPVPIPVAPRNAMPSLHAAAALLVFWNSIAWPKWARAATAMFLICTVLATLGFGEHYLVDLVVAVPLSLALQAAWTRGLPWNTPERRDAFLVGSMTTLVWLAVLRLGRPPMSPSPALGWAAIAVTVLPCALLLRRLMRSALIACPESNLISADSPTRPQRDRPAQSAG